MSECQLMCSPVVGCKRCAEAKCIVEGECCALAYNEDGDWFDNEDEEFFFENSSGWFEDALVAGLKERDEMLHSYRSTFMLVLDENVKGSLDYVKEKNEKNNKTVGKKANIETVEKKGTLKSIF